MDTRNHYENHLAGFYAWSVPDFRKQAEEFKTLLTEHSIKPAHGADTAIDLGAGHGVQTIALAELGYAVTAIDFSEKLLTDLSSRVQQGMSVQIINSDIRKFRDHGLASSLIVCCGDTLTHLDNIEEVPSLIGDAYAVLQAGGHFIVSFRDYSAPLYGTGRFIPVKSDDTRIHTCFLEYETTHVNVTDLVHEKIDGEWRQRAGSYKKIRLGGPGVRRLLTKTGFEIIYDRTVKGFVTLIARKP